MVCNRLQKGKCNANQKQCSKNYEMKMISPNKCSIYKTSHPSTIVKKKRKKKEVVKQKSWFAKLFRR